MANILDKYGIKEVADVTFYDINDDGSRGAPVLYLDTLKVSTIEQTAEEAEARGGKGNPPLIIWDYGKEITVTLEDALFSAKSMAIMFGNGTVKNVNATDTVATIYKTVQFTATASGTSSVGKPTNWQGPDGKPHAIASESVYDATGRLFDSAATESNAATKFSAYEQGQTYYVTFPVTVNGGVIEISASNFPGTYYVTGDTYARSQQTGTDEFFQFIIPKAKVQSENTITLEAEGDPSVFNMNLRVLRPDDGVMMKLVKYDLGGDEPGTSTNNVIIYDGGDVHGNSEG